MSKITTELVHLPSSGLPGAPAPYLSCRVAGPKGAPLLLFLHGFPEAAFVWDALLAHFGDRYRCVAPNLRGYPGSYSPSEVKAYRANVVLGDLIGLIQQQAAIPDTPAAAVIAHDWGGALAWGLAAVAPHSMQRLVILNAPHPGLFLAALRDDPAQQAASSYMNGLRQPDIEGDLAADDFARMWPFFERFGGATWLTPALRAQYREAWSHGLTGPLNYYRASPLHPPTSPTDSIHTLQLPDALLHVNVPTSVVWGEADTALPPSLLDGLAAYVPDLHITRLPHASHWLLHEAPDAVTQAIEAALARPLTALIDAATLSASLACADHDWLVIDCRFNLGDTQAGEAAYQQGHIAGAHYAHLDRDLSGAKTGRNGRHPLPTEADFNQACQRWGIAPSTRVVAYDDAGGIFAARLWWLLRWSGHAQVQVLDGGWQAWQALSGPVDTAIPLRAASAFKATRRADWVRDADTVGAHLGQPDKQVLLDARAPDRFRGENETMDPVGGHIPGAHNRFFQLNLQAPQGCFKPPAQLKAEFTALLGQATLDAGTLVHQCGSGVTACHNLLAMAHAGLPAARLYAGSWSEWCSDPARPVER